MKRFEYSSKIVRSRRGSPSASLALTSDPASTRIVTISTLPGLPWKPVFVLLFDSRVEKWIVIGVSSVNIRSCFHKNCHNIHITRPPVEAVFVLSFDSHVEKWIVTGVSSVNIRSCFHKNCHNIHTTRTPVEAVRIKIQNCPMKWRVAIGAGYIDVYFGTYKNSHQIGVFASNCVAYGCSIARGLNSRARSGL